MSDTDDELLSEFLVEAFSMLDDAREAISACQPEGGSASAFVDRAFRAIHTIKGNAAMFEFATTSAAAHGLEDVLAQYRDEHATIPPEVVREILSQMDHIDDLLHGRDAEPGASALPAATATGDPAQATGTPSPASATPATRREILRVPLSRINDSLGHIWEIFLIRNQMAYLFEHHKAELRGHHEFVQSWEVLDNALRRNISELESKAMGMRMHPVRVVYDRVEKAIRAYLAKHSKRVSLHREGDDVEVDKRVVDTLTEPMIHLIRNALDHGVETPTQRREIGKPEEGSITLRTRIVGERVEIEIEDDGKGIDGAAILESARTKGIDVGGIRTPNDALELIFLPGFSTAESVTDVSGRGVGMAAVQSSIAELRGTIAIETNVGQGTKFVIGLPLSLSVINAIVFELGEHMYAAAIANVVEICRVAPHDLQSNGGEQFFLLREEFVPCVELTDVIDTDVPGTASAVVTLIVLALGDRLVGVRVSAVVANTELVAKPTPPRGLELEYVSGISILPTGTPLFILNLELLARRALAQRVGKVSHAA